ncbi:apolipoprotein N-acyltransferase [Nocardioides sp. J2M5]|uniref:apolipoprotein N-acyltransferase n=1 Tax=Nocardioides palaemonis TaxID=2829810 RepID=UPI001BA47422|nr:apolipoprotein N-acyltransferase [Nocardioides palaemonis]MBS2938908.1 apolipoprotein N-acyltransferase [Nocardioides palaemonis]
MEVWVELTGRQSVTAAVAGGLVLGACFAPWSVSWLAPVGVAGFVVSVSSGPRRSAPCGAVFGVVFVGVTSWWLAESIAPAAWVALTLVQSMWFGALGVLTRILREELRAWPVWTACAWTAVESARSAWPWGGFPWGRLGLTALDTPWVGSLAALGVAGTSVLIALGGALLAVLARSLRHQGPRPVSPTTIVALSVAGLTAVVAAHLAGRAGGWQVAGGAGERSVRIAVVQAEVPGGGTDVVSHHRAVTDTLMAETRTAALRWRASGRAPDLVVWPENATAVDPARDLRARSALAGAARAAGVPLLAGSIVDGGRNGVLNQAILWSGAGSDARYTKQHLVPFGEYVPLRPLAERLSSRVAEIGRDMTPGPAAAPMDADGLRIANALCFDVAYDDVLRYQVRQGADVVVVQTSNAMFLGTAQQEQQWAISRVRAVEMGRSVVVSSMNGITGVVSYDGSVLERLPDTRAGATVVDVPIASGMTLATRVGAWPSRVTGALAIASLFVAVRRRRRKGGRGSRPAAGNRGRGEARANPHSLLETERVHPC